jgi:hypothetical protein
MATIIEMKKEPVDFLSSVPCSRHPHFVRTNASFVRTNAAFMSTNASLMRTSASLMLVSQLTRPLSNTLFVHTSDALIGTNASFVLASHLIDLEILKRCRFCNSPLSSTESITAKKKKKQKKQQPPRKEPRPNPTASLLPARPACRPPQPSSRS